MSVEKKRTKTGRKEKVTVASVVEALRKSRGIARYAAQSLGVHRQTIANMAKKHPAVLAAMTEEREGLIDTAEAKLAEAISRGELGAITFYLKTQAKNRGYYERHSTEMVQLTPEMLDRFTSEQLERLVAGEPLSVVLATGAIAQAPKVR